MFIKSSRIKGYILLFFCCFPFIGCNIGTDVQPFAFLASVFLVMCSARLRIYDKNRTCMLAVILFIWMILSFGHVAFFQVMKRMFSYASVILISIAAENSGLDVQSRSFERTLKVFMTVWLFMGMAQMFISRSFGAGIVPLMRSDPWRGVTSLASEPSFYGYMCFFFFLLARDFQKHRNAFMLMQIIQTVLLAQSSVAVIYFMVYYALCAVHMLLHLTKKNILKLVLALAAAVLVLCLAVGQSSYYRIIYLLQNFLEGNMEIWSTDVSLYLRLKAVLDSFSRLGVPSWIGENSLIAMSGFGSAFYELGIASFVLYAWAWKRIWRAYQGDDRWIILLSVTAAMCSAVQLSAPVFAFFLGYCTMKRGILNETVCSRFKLGASWHYGRNRILYQESFDRDWGTWKA